MKFSAAHELPRFDLRTLPLTNGNGKLVWGAPFYFLAACSFPNDPVKRERFVNANVAAATWKDASESDDPSIRAEVPKMIDAAAELPELNRESDQANNAIAVVGDVLMLVLALDVQDLIDSFEALEKKQRPQPPQATLNRAIAIAAVDRARYMVKGGKPVPASRAAIMEMWARWKPAAGFCAAWQSHAYLDAHGKHSIFDSFERGYDEAAFRQLLADAEALRRRGEGFFPPIGRYGTTRSTSPLLDPTKTLRCPPDLLLPAGDFYRPVIGDRIRKILASYRRDD
jgi:hypothetical protein